MPEHRCYGCIFHLFMRQRYFTLGLLVLAIGVLIFPACKKEEAVKALPPPDVLVQDAATRDVPVYREWIGTLDGSENAEIRARVTGYLLKRDYQEGALVKKGDVLFEIDPRPFRGSACRGEEPARAGSRQCNSRPRPRGNAARNFSTRG